MRYKKTLALGVVAAVGAVVVACGGGGGDSSFEISSGTLISNVTVVSTRDGSLRPAMSVVVNAGKITRVTSDVLSTTGAAVKVDGTGKYLVPGYNDMHTHALATIANPPSDFPVLLANGVTGVREASGAPELIPVAKQRNAAVAAGTLDAPEILIMPSTIYAGQAPTDPAARQFVRDRIAEGADFIKVVGGPRAAVLAAIDEAKIQKSYVAGHLVDSISALEASNAGWRSFEHLGAGWGLVLGCATDEGSIRAAALANPAPPPANVINPQIYSGNQYAPLYQRIMDTYSDAKCTSLAQTLAANGTWQPVTLIRFRTMDYGDSQQYRADPNLKYVDKTRRALWESTAQQYESTVTPAARATLQQFYQLQGKVTKLLKQNGAKVLAGSDLGGGWVIPGFSLHQEFRELATAGLTPLDILQATTLLPAQFLGRESTMGAVEEGKNADLVLLDGNPVVDVANLDRINAVFLKGKLYTRASLDKLLADVASTYASQPLRDLQSALDPTHKD